MKIVELFLIVIILQLLDQTIAQIENHSHNGSDSRETLLEKHQFENRDKFYTNECRNDWFNYKNEKCIKIIESKASYLKAKEECHKLNSTLITIESREENLFITSLLYGIDSKTDGLFIGLKRKKLKGIFVNEFEWEDKTPLKYENWSPGEPTDLDEDYKDNKDNEDCVEIHSSEIFDGKWNDLRCGSHRYAICQQFINSTEHVFQFEMCENSQYVRYRDSCYKIYDKESAMTWIQANNQCIKDHKNGRLLWIDNSFEHSFIKYWTQLKMKSIEFWIGLHSKKDSSELQYEWINEWPVHYTMWSSNEPNINSEIEHQCVNQDRDLGLWKNDHLCDDKQAFICKINDQSIPGDESYNNLVCPLFVDKRYEDQKDPSIHSLFSRNPFRGLGRKRSVSSNNQKDVWLNLHKRSKYCYWFSDKRYMHWSSSSKHCRSLNGTLVSIHSRYESELLKPLLRKYNHHIWIGLHQSKSGQYEWEDESAVDFTNWYPGEPSDEKIEHCVEMKSQGMTWNDLKCNGTSLQFICQIQKVIPNSNKTEDEETKTSTEGNLDKISNFNKNETKDLFEEMNQKFETKTVHKNTSGGVILLIIVLTIISLIFLFVGYYLWVNRDARSVGFGFQLKIRQLINQMSTDSQPIYRNDVL